MNWWKRLTYKLPQPVCHNTAIMAAMVMKENSIPFRRVWDSPEGRPGHMQTKALIDGKWEWITVEAKMWIGVQEKQWEGKVFEVDCYRPLS